MKSWTGPDEYYPMNSKKKVLPIIIIEKNVRVKNYCSHGSTDKKNPAPTGPPVRTVLKIVRIYSVVDEKIKGEENAMRCSGTDRKGIVGGLNHKK